MWKAAWAIIMAMATGSAVVTSDNLANGALVDVRSTAQGRGDHAPTIRASFTSMQFIAVPTRDTMPLLPDIPIPLNAAELVMPDAPPLITMMDRQAAVDLQEVTPTRANLSPEAQKNLRRITAELLNMRRGPSSGTEVVARLAAGQEVRNLGQSKRGWILVQTLQSGRRGWVFARYTEPAG